jgi:hypothetical protein
LPNASSGPGRLKKRNRRHRASRRHAADASLRASRTRHTARSTHSPLDTQPARHTARSTHSPLHTQPAPHTARSTHRSASKSATRCTTRLTAGEKTAGHLVDRSQGPEAGPTRSATGAVRPYRHVPPFRRHADLPVGTSHRPVVRAAVRPPPVRAALPVRASYDTVTSRRSFPPGGPAATVAASFGKSSQFVLLRLSGGGCRRVSRTAPDRRRQRPRRRPVAASSERAGVRAGGCH